MSAGNNVPPIEPDSMNLQAAYRLVDEALAARIFSAVSYAVAVDGHTVAQGSAGIVSFADGAAAVGPGTLFDAASLTKPVVTATAALQLVEEGRLTLVQSVGKLLEPTYGPIPALDGIEIRHLLTHTSGLPPIPQPFDPSTSGRFSAIRSALETPPLRPARVGYTYSDTGYIALGEAVATVSAAPLDQCATKIFKPLGMKSACFSPSSKHPVVQTDPTVRAGVVHDPRARAMDGVAGHAGLFANALDLLKFAEAIRSGGGAILSRASVARMSVSQLPPEIGAMSLGWFCEGNDFLPRGDLFSNRSFGHSGFTGCALLIDPEYNTSVVLLTNRVLNTAQDGMAFLRFRRAWINAIAAAVTRG